jgi:hypothetical protein
MERTIMIDNTNGNEKGLPNLPTHITEFFSLDSPPELPDKEKGEYDIFKKFIDNHDSHGIVKPVSMRFGYHIAREPDIVVSQGEQLIGVEITEIYGSYDIAIAYNTSSRKTATVDQWCQAIKKGYKKKLSNRKDGKNRYNRSKFDRIKLFIDDRSGLDFAPPDLDLTRMIHNGTPEMMITRFQQLFQCWSRVIDESYLLGWSSKNKLGTILIRGHLNVD